MAQQANQGTDVTITAPHVAAALLVPSGGADEIQIGSDGDDVFAGGAGRQFMHGGAGNDFYTVDSQADLVFEAPGGGDDTVLASSDFQLYDNIETLVLAPGAGDIHGVGNALDNMIIGNEGNNLLLGGDGNDEIHGGLGNDTIFGEAGNDSLYADGGTDALAGGAGNDQYWVDGMQDLIFEDANGGAEDLVNATVGAGAANAYYLYANLEGLRLLGSADSWGVGNELDNFITGNDGNNGLLGGAGDDMLDGGAGNDTLWGGDGRDLLHAGTGTDMLAGGAGNDEYWVDGMEDLIFEDANGGDEDFVNTNAAAGPENAYYLYANIEGMRLLGTADSWAVGNELDNFIDGNEGANWMFGGAGNDTIIGRGGNDVLFGGAGADLFVFGTGYAADRIVDFTVGVDQVLLYQTALQDFAAVQAAMREVDGSTAIELGNGDLVVLAGVAMASLSASDFIYE